MKKFNLTIDGIINYITAQSDIKVRAIMLTSGLLSALAFAPLYILPLYIITIPLLLLVTLTSRSIREAFLNGYAFGIGHYFAGFYWIGNSFAVEPDVPDWAGYLMVFVLASLLAIFIGLVAVVVKYIHRNHSINSHLFPACLTFIVAWSFAEWLRGNIFTGFPWNLSGYVWGFSDIMLQTTAIWGVYGLGTITLCLCFIPLLMLNVNYRKFVFCGGLVIISGLFYYGYDRLPDDIDYVDGIKLRIVQPNISQEDKWAYENWSKNLIKYMDMSEVDDEKVITHVIWPETAVIYSLSEEPFRRQLITQVLGSGGKLLTGFPRRQSNANESEIFNSMIVMNETGEIEEFYDKSHLVPFGEYTPAFIRNIITMLGLENLFPGALDFNEGEGVKTLEIEGLPPVGVLICYEIIFPGQVVDPQNRPEWLLNITNDAWYGESAGPYQHLLQSRVRSIEEGLPLVRSAGTGMSAVIDPYGRELHKISLNNKGTINSELPKPLSTNTIYSIYKEWIFACINVILMIAVLVFVRRKAFKTR